jgi:hypothetical protein
MLSASKHKADELIHWWWLCPAMHCRRYLSDQHDATTIAVLLGMSAACRGTADSTVARMLFLHLPARHPNTFPEIELSPHVQVGSCGMEQQPLGSSHAINKVYNCALSCSILISWWVLPVPALFLHKILLCATQAGNIPAICG